MTEASYTAWDDKQYVWPPPDGWYQASDEKWWPEGYGPQPAEPAAPDEAAAEVIEEPIETSASNDLIDQISAADFGSDADSVSDAAQNAATSNDAAGVGTTLDGAFDSITEAPAAVGDAVGGLSENASGLADRASGFGAAATGIGGRLGDTATESTDAASGFGDRVSGLGDQASGFGDGIAGIADKAPAIDDLDDLVPDGIDDLVPDDLVPDGIDDLVPDDLVPDAIEDRLSISDVDGLPTSDIRESGALDGFDLPSTGGDITDAANGVGDLADDIPSIQDLASPDLDLSSLPSGPGAGEDVTQVVPTNIAGQFSDPLPPPPGTGPTFDAPPPPGLDGLPSPDVDVPSFDAPSFDAPSFEAPSFDAPEIDAPEIDAPSFDAPGIDAPSFDTPGIETQAIEPPAFEVPSFEIPVVEPPTFDAPTVEAPGFAAPPQGSVDGGIAAPNPAMGGVPPQAQLPPVGQPPQQQFENPGFGQAAAPGIAIQQDILASGKSGGRSKTLLFVLLGVLALAIIGALLYWQFGRGGDDGDSAAAATGPGSVNQPHPRTTGVVVFYPDGDTDQRWVIEVLDPVSVGTGDLAAGSGDGDVFAVTRVRVRNESGSNDASIGDLRFNAVNDAGELIDRESNQCPSTGEDLDYGASVAVGAETIGAVCWELPASDLDGLKLGLESEKVAGRVHIALQ